MTRRLRSGDVVPVTLPAWIVQDGAQPYPDHGDTVSYALEFWVPKNASADHLVTVQAGPVPDGTPDFVGQRLLDFGAFVAVGTLDDVVTDSIDIGVRFSVDYEITVREEGRCVGTVVRRRLVTLIKHHPDTPARTELIDLDPGEKRGFRDTSLGLTEIHPDGTWTTHPAPDTWERATGLLLDIELT